MKISTIMAAAALAALLYGAACAGQEENGEDLEKTIDYLLEYVRSCDGCVFIRNDDEHSPADAADHMERKYRHYRRRIETPEDFIRLAGSRSILSGKPYRIRLQDGTVMLTREWLEKELARYRAEGAARPDSLDGAGNTGSPDSIDGAGKASSSDSTGKDTTRCEQRSLRR